MDTIKGKNGGTLKPFQNGHDPRRNTNGRGVSLKQKLEGYLDGDGIIEISKDQILETKDNGNIIIQLSTKDGIAIKLINHAMGSGSKSFEALKFIAEWIDGKAKQQLDLRPFKPKRIGYGPEPDDNQLPEKAT